MFNPPSKIFSHGMQDIVPYSVVKVPLINSGGGESQLPPL